MKKITFLFLLLSFMGFGQVTTNPSPAIATGPVTLFFDKAGTGLAGYNGTIYAHIGLTVNDDDWLYVIGDWGNNGVQPALTFVSGTTYKLELMPDLFTYFGVPEGNTITAINVVFRSADGSQQTSDLVAAVGSFQVTLTAPGQNSTTLLASGSNLTISATNTGGNASYELFANGESINTNAGTSSYSFTHTDITANQNYELVVTQGESTVIKEFSVIVAPVNIITTMPEGLVDGINYDPEDNTRATLVLSAPGKDFVYVAGSFNDWTPGPGDAMVVDAESGKFFLELSGLVPGELHTYQYWVVDQTPIAGSPAIVKTADPFSTLVLSPFDDGGIPEASYPNLPEYPQGQEREVTVLQTGQVPYDWQVTDFEKPKKEDLVIYEVLIRDFDETRTYQDIIDRMDYFTGLGINAIELMPVMEYEGNESWGYNTVFHMANDKFYGPADKLRELVDTCHQNGIAVILDIALNHAFGRNPMVRMWMNDPDADGWGGPTAENPYFNTVATHSYNVGNDFNHQQPLTQEYVKRVVRHWIEEYNIDGFRWDLTKGFTQNCTEGDQGCTNAYQQDRVDILKEYVDYSWSIDPTHYAIFEHLGSDAEEKEWANFKYDEGKGVMMWGKMTDSYNQLTMGYADNSGIARVGHQAHSGFAGKRVVGYAESHDEERIMYKNKMYGNSTNPSHDVKNMSIALSRMPALGAVFFTVPGPKMIWQFGELGWDLSIFTCNNGTVNEPGGTDGDCKLDTKPQPQWDENWLDSAQRAQIYYAWKQMIHLKTTEPVFEGNYTISPAGNTLTPKIYVTDNSLPDTELNSVVVLSNFNVTAQNVVPNFPATGTWYNLMNNNPLEVADAAAPISLQPGEYRIYGNAQVTLGSEDEFAAQKAALYPNPTADMFTISIPTARVEVYSIAGQLVKSFGGDVAYGLYTVSDLANGMYLVKITDTNGRQAAKKLIIQ